MASDRIILVLGAGPNLGTAVATKFIANGYKAALAARSVEPGMTGDGILNIKADFDNPEAVLDVFKHVKESLGIPNIVIYNVANRLLTPPEDPLSASLDTLQSSRKVGLDSAYLAAQEALNGFKALSHATPTAFIYTGNTLNQMPIPGVMPFALGKVAAAMFIEYAANAYGKDGYRFYYADERRADGRPAANDHDGRAHAEIYWELANEASQSKWLVTFVKGHGREDFVGVDFEGGTRASYDLQFGR